MTKIRKLKRGFILAGVFLACSCSPKQVRTVQIAFDNACTLEQQKNAYEVINKRLEVWDVTEKTDLTDGKFDLSYVVGKRHNANSDTLLAQILTERGEIYITEIGYIRWSVSLQSTNYKSRNALKGSNQIK